MFCDRGKKGRYGAAPRPGFKGFRGFKGKVLKMDRPYGPEGS